MSNINIDEQISIIDDYIKAIKLELHRLEGMRIVFNGFKEAGIKKINC
jgi:hypothetical protein